MLIVAIGTGVRLGGIEACGREARAIQTSDIGVAG